MWHADPAGSLSGVRCSRGWTRSSGCRRGYARHDYRVKGSGGNKSSMRWPPCFGKLCVTGRRRGRSHNVPHGLPLQQPRSLALWREQSVQSRRKLNEKVGDSFEPEQTTTRSSLTSETKADGDRFCGRCTQEDRKPFLRPVHTESRGIPSLESETSMPTETFSAVVHTDSHGAALHLL